MKQSCVIPTAGDYYHGDTGYPAILHRVNICNALLRNLPSVSYSSNNEFPILLANQFSQCPSISYRVRCSVTGAIDSWLSISLVHHRSSQNLTQALSYSRPQVLTDTFGPASSSSVLPHPRRISSFETIDSVCELRAKPFCFDVLERIGVRLEREQNVPRLWQATQRLEFHPRSCLPPPMSAQGK